MGAAAPGKMGRAGGWCTVAEKRAGGRGEVVAWEHENPETTPNQQAVSVQPQRALQARIKGVAGGEGERRVRESAAEKSRR